jgi:hypothetical protein
MRFLKFISIALLFSLSLINSQEASSVRTLTPNDIRITRLNPALNGFDLFVRKKPGIESIMLTDSTVDGEGIQHNYGLRAYDAHPTFANEIRNLDNRTISPEDGSYYLLTSQARVFKGLDDDEWFHLFVPSAVVYGHAVPGGREGQLDMTGDIWLNIRTFTQPHATYDLNHPDRGFHDNPFSLRIGQPRPANGAIIALGELSNQTGGQFFNNMTSGQQLSSNILNILNTTSGSITKVVLVIDTTISMKNVLPFVQEKVIPAIFESMQDRMLEIGLVVYRDYEDLLKGAYLTKQLTPVFTSNLTAVLQAARTLKAGGGHDIPEAVYEGIETAVHGFDWSQADSRIIIQIGDAEPHPVPKSRRVRENGQLITITGPTREEIINLANQHNITVYTLLLPTDADYVHTPPPIAPPF